MNAPVRVAPRLVAHLLDAGASDLSFRTAPPPDICCPLTRQPFQDPVQCVDGLTYERAAIQQWLTRFGTSPVTGVPVGSLLPRGGAAAPAAAPARRVIVVGSDDEDEDSEGDEGDEHHAYDSDDFFEAPSRRRVTARAAPQVPAGAASAGTAPAAAATSAAAAPGSGSASAPPSGAPAASASGLARTMAAVLAPNEPMAERVRQWLAATRPHAAGGAAAAGGAGSAAAAAAGATAAAGAAGGAAPTAAQFQIFVRLPNTGTATLTVSAATSALELKRDVAARLSVPPACVRLSTSLGHACLDHTTVQECGILAGWTLTCALVPLPPGHLVVAAIISQPGRRGLTIACHGDDLVRDVHLRLLRAQLEEAGGIVGALQVHDSALFQARLARWPRAVPRVMPAGGWRAWW